jgi:hypothetical protein
VQQSTAGRAPSNTNDFCFDFLRFSLGAQKVETFPLVLLQAFATLCGPATDGRQTEPLIDASVHASMYGGPADLCSSSNMPILAGSGIARGFRAMVVHSGHSV